MGMAWKLPLKVEPDGGVSDYVYKLLLSAFETYIRIKQMNAKVICNTTNLLFKRVNIFMNNMSNITKLFQHLLQESEIDFKVTVCNPI